MSQHTIFSSFATVPVTKKVVYDRVLWTQNLSLHSKCTLIFEKSQDVRCSRTPITIDFFTFLCYIFWTIKSVLWCFITEIIAFFVKILLILLKILKKTSQSLYLCYLYKNKKKLFNFFKNFFIFFFRLRNFLTLAKMGIFLLLFLLLIQF